MTYERPEALEIGSVEDVVLGMPKRVAWLDAFVLPMYPNLQVAEVAE